MVRHGCAHHSDHIPIMFETSCSNDFYQRKKTFPFESMWVGEDQCEQIIEHNWGVNVNGSDMERVMHAIKSYGEDLTVWNKVVFGHV